MSENQHQHKSRANSRVDARNQNGESQNSRNRSGGPDHTRNRSSNQDARVREGLASFVDNNANGTHIMHEEKAENEPDDHMEDEHADNEEDEQRDSELPAAVTYNERTRLRACIRKKLVNVCAHRSKQPSSACGTGSG